MIKIVIVDDEPVIREGLRTIIDWEKYGFAICGEAVNGRDGIAKIKELRPELVISDIKMPGVNGLEMIQELKQQNVKMHSILLSGYSEFSYAQKAIELGIDNYILKPIEKEELIEKLLFIKEIIQREQLLKEEKDEIHKEKYLFQLLSGLVPNEEDSEWERYQADFAASSWQVLIGVVSGDRISHEIAQAVKEYMAKNYDVLAKMQDNYLILLVLNKELKESSKSLELLYTHIQKKYHTEMLFLLGSQVDSMEMISESYAEAMELMDYRFLYEYQRYVLTSERLNRNESDNHEIHQAVEPALLEELYTAVVLNCDEQVRKLIDEMCVKISQRCFREEEIKSFFVKIYVMITSRTLANNPELKELMKVENNYVEKMFRISNLKDLQEYLTGILVSLGTGVGKCKPEKIIERIMDYINHNYADEIKLETFASILYYSSSYLGKLFKSVVGVSFNTYLDQIRIEKAKEFILEGNKVYEVAKMVGFYDRDYFSEKFKKYVGIPPSIFKTENEKSSMNGTDDDEMD